MVAKFCADNGIVLLADEGYQRNVYPTDRAIIGAKKVVAEIAGCESIELQGFDWRVWTPGWLHGEMINIDPYVRSQILMLASSVLCSGFAG
eukprot:scaffold24045_cov76-Amphora_coffeaeformis.AAC.1